MNSHSVQIKISYFLILTLITVDKYKSDSIKSNQYWNSIIQHVNSNPYIKWQAAYNQKFLNSHDGMKLIGTRFENPSLKFTRRPTISHKEKTVVLPVNFDARQNWPDCYSIQQIRDQSACGSCWAFGAVEAMTDRLCIHTEGRIQMPLSAIDLLLCCEKCGFGCEGGWTGPAWDYWKESGIVTGASLEENDGCLPYPFPQCNHHSNDSRPHCREETYSAPPCYSKCSNPVYPTTYQDDKFYANSSYNVEPNEESIMIEIMLHGPVEGSINVYEDFIVYSGGVYHHISGKLLGGHAIKILGWGIDNHTKYWLCANSWNVDWGENGFFRILRGEKECGIESEIVAGLPKPIDQ